MARLAVQLALLLDGLAELLVASLPRDPRSSLRGAAVEHLPGPAHRFVPAGHGSRETVRRKGLPLAPVFADLGFATQDRLGLQPAAFPAQWPRSCPRAGHRWQSTLRPLGPKGFVLLPKTVGFRPLFALQKQSRLSAAHLQGQAGSGIRLGRYTPSCHIGQVENSFQCSDLTPQRCRLNVGESDGIVFLSGVLQLVFSPSAKLVPGVGGVIDHLQKSQLGGWL